MIWVRRLTLGVLALLAVGGMALGWLLATESGARWSLQRASAELPGLRLTDVSGTWLDGLGAQTLAYDDGAGIRVHINELWLQWQPAALLVGRVRITALQAQRVTVGLPASAADEPTVLPELTSPWPVSVSGLSVGALTIDQGEAPLQFADISAGVRLDRGGLRVQQLRLGGHGFRLGGRLGLGPAPERVVDAQLDWRLDQPSLGGRLTVSGDLRELEVRQQLEGELQAELRGRVMPDLDRGQHRVDLAGDWSGLVLQSAEGPVNLDAGKIALAGTLNDYRLDLSAKVTHARAGRWVVRLDGRGDVQQFQVTAGQLDGPAGSLQLLGKLAWSPVLAASLRLAGRDLDPSAVLPEWPGRLALRAEVDARQGDAGPELTVQVEHLAGSLRGYPVAADGLLELRGDRLRVSDVTLASGDNRAWVKGSLAPLLDLDLRIDAPNLAQVAPDLAGALHGTLQVSGELERLALGIDATGSKLSLGDLRLARLEATGRVFPADGPGSHWQVRGQGLGLGEQRVDDFSIDGTGNAEAHRFILDAKGPHGTLRAAAEGGYLASAWQGRITDLVVTSPLAGTWELEAPAGVNAGATEQQVAPFCLTGAHGRLCGNGRRDQAGLLRLAANWEGLPLALVQPWLAVDTVVSGTVSGQLQAQGPIQGLTAQGHVNVSPGEIRVRPEDGPELITTHRDGEATFDYTAGQLTAEGNWYLGDQGRLSANIMLARPGASGQDLSGELLLNLPDPTPFAALLSGVTDLAGPVSLGATLGGTREQPVVRLRGQWREGRLKLPALGIALTAIDMEVQGDGDRLALAGRATSAPGELRLTGELRLDAAAGWPLQLRAEGENFTILRRSDVEARVSPALDLRSERGLIEARGRLLVPYARIVGTSLPRGAVRPSEDEVLVGEAPAATPAPAAGPRVKADIRVELGDQVTVDTQGLTGRLTGELRLIQEPGARPEGSGQLEVVDGRYRAYGQDLTIERGRLLFGGPLENPDVDVRASRRIGQVTAGILLGGRLADPNVQLFSEPAMDQADVLSYLLTGGPVGASGSFSPVMLAEAAAGLGLDKSGDFAGELAAGLGIDEFTIESGSSGLESSMMAIGKQLSPDLYLRYLYGLFDNTASVQIRYHVSERVRVEVQEGQQRAADLIYEFERD